MEYENRPIPEGINVSETHPLVDFASLLAGVALLFAVIFGTVYGAAGLLLPHVPFEFEEVLVESFDEDGLFNEPLPEDQQRAEDALQALADELLAGHELPEGMVIRVHYSPSQDKNAFATLAGNIVINQGLLDSVSSENALAMVLAHEIGHIVHRDPIMATGRVAVTITGLALISGFSQSSVADQVFGLSADGLLLSFSRDQEREADDYALELLRRHYGHLGGADEFFRHVLNDDELRNSEWLDFFSTHPGLEERIENVEEARVAADGVPVALPDVLAELGRDREAE
ncbi:MAG: M48 family metallopeptidase [Halieaceae bacterium]|jgi:Zn-dependent protease with chaperone function|nr:M48 family metallopeptidase [Halieaceae bacterium]